VSSEYKRHLAFLLLVAAIVLLAGLGFRDPWPADEPRFALIARDMAEGGDWLIPRVGGVIYPDKPPLFFWLVGGFYEITGSIRVSFLMPGVLAGFGSLLLVTDLGRRLWGPKTAIWCGATLLALIQFPLQMKSGQIDGLLCLWTTLGLYGLARHLLLGPDWRWYAIGGLSVGLGVITKGVGFLPYLIFIPYALVARKDWPVSHRTWRDPRWALAPLASFAVIGLWLIPMLVVTAGGSDPDLTAYRDNILFHQTVTRYAASWGHVKPPWYLFTNAIPWLWLPVSALLPWLLPAWWRDIRNKNAAILLLGSWVLLVVIFFSISAGKRSLYIFPAAPALALIAGYHAESLLQRVNVRRLLAFTPVLFALLLIAVGIFAMSNADLVHRWLSNDSVIQQVSVAVSIIGGLMLTVLIVSYRNTLRGFALAMLVFWVGISLAVFPPLNDNRSGRELMGTLDAVTGPELELGLVAWPEQFLLQLNRTATHFGYRRDRVEEVADAVQWLSKSETRRLLLPEMLTKSCFDASGLTPLGRAHRRNWMIADRSSLSGECG